MIKSWKYRQGTINNKALGALGVIVIPAAVAYWQNQAMESYANGNKNSALYEYGRQLTAVAETDDYFRRVIRGEVQEVEALPWHRRWFEKWSASNTISFDGGMFMPYP